MSTITSLGVGSGLDISSLVSDLVEAEKTPATARLDAKQETYEAELSAYGRLKGALADFQASLQSLNSLADFKAHKATSGNDQVLTATALKTASAGTYAIEVERLAQAHKLGSAMLDGDAKIGGSSGDSLQISVGDESMSLDLSSGMTLAEIRDAINDSESNPGLTASLISGDDGQQALVLTAKESGYDQRIQLSYGSEAVETALGMTTANLDDTGAALTDLQDLDSQILVDGYRLNRSSNQVGDVISGITLNLLDAEPGTKVNLTVAKDDEKLTEAVTSFTESYNALVEIMEELGKYDAVNGENGALLGDAALRNVQTQLRRELTSAVSGLSGSANALSGIGITTASDGTLEIDETKLEQFISQNPEDLALMFAGEDGVATRLDRVISAAIGTSGTINNRYEGIETSLAGITEERETLDRRLEALQSRYLAQFTAMDTLVSQLNATGTYLTQQLDNLPGFTYQNN